jgi:hypothetical protein
MIYNKRLYKIQKKTLHKTQYQALSHIHAYVSARLLSTIYCSSLIITAMHSYLAM